MRKELPMFVWFPHDRINENWRVLINGINVRDDIISAEFTRSIIGEESGFKIELENSGETYTGEFDIGHIVEFDYDLTDGTTAQFIGTIDHIKKKISDGFTLQIVGSHYQNTLLDITITKEYSNLLVSDILKDLVDNNLTGYTYANVDTINVTVSKIKWKNKSFYDCVIDLTKLGNAECFVDNNKDFNMFLKGSKENINEAFVEDHDIIELRELGEDSVNVRNKIIVYGSAGDLPVIYTSQDATSQTKYGTKDKIIEDLSIINASQAKELGNAERDLAINPPTKGNLTSHLMPLLVLGSMTYVVSIPHDITDKYRLVKYTFFVPNETMEIFFTEDAGVPKLFQERIQKDTAQEDIVNPHKMLYSINFTFDDLTNVSSSSNVEVSNGNLRLILSGNGNLVSINNSTTDDVTQVHLLVKGEQWIGNTTFKISADGTDNFQIITADTLTNVTNRGKTLKLRIEITSTTTLIDSVALLYK